MEEIWKKTLEKIKEKTTESEYDTWFSRLTPGPEKNGTVTFYVNSAFIKDAFEARFAQITEQELSIVADKPLKIKLEIAKKNFSETHSESEKDSSSTSSEKNNSSEKEKKISPAKSKQDCLLNPSYTFESFVPGENSNFAYSAALAIANNPGSTYNPCLLYGGVGLGKTHLLQSIGNFLQKTSDLKIMYVTSENFTNEFIQSLKTKTQMQFKRKYRKVNVLLMDDIQFLQGREGIQTELYNTFNDLYDTGKQVVFASDRPVEELKDISERLRSRFSRGLNIDIQPPNFETRVAILQAKCKEKNFSISPDVLEYIAKNISSNVRALESCITKLMAYSKLLNKEIVLETAAEQLKQIINLNTDPSGISMNLIIKIVSSYYNISPFDIKGKNRGQSIILARQVAMYLCRTLTDYSTTEIATEFGGKNHTSVIYNVNKIENMIKNKEDSEENEIEKIIRKLSNLIKQESRKTI